MRKMAGYKHDTKTDKKALFRINRDEKTLDTTSNYAGVWKYLGIVNHKKIGVLRTIEITRKGLPKKSLAALANSLDIPTNRLDLILPISRRSIERFLEPTQKSRKHFGHEKPCETNTYSKAVKPLSAEVSDHMVQVAKVIARANEVLGDTKVAQEWLKSPIPALGESTPFSLLDTSTGIDLVLDELGRLEHGVFS